MISGISSHFPLIDRARKELPAFLSFLAFFFVTALFFRSWEFALIVAASLGFHELGHAAALSWLGLDWRISFGFLGAWTWSNAEQRARLPQIANVSIHMMGPVFSLLLAVMALVLHNLFFPADRNLLILANFSAHIGFLNLLPIGAITDGGKVVRAIVTSVDGLNRLREILFAASITILIFVLYAWVQLPRLNTDTALYFIAGLLLIWVWMLDSLHLEASSAQRRKQNHPTQSVAQGCIPVTGHPERVKPALPLSFWQIVIVILLLWEMLAAYLVIILGTPFWLDPIYVEGALK
ncbi:MAG TPA: hypothetical protein VMS73_09720, partial [Anaerolineaceae bacterium]|nr:hypothetical protein [Anaerolineaceae bacterium]